MTTNSTAPPKFGRAAEVRAASYDEGENSVEVVWTTGASVRRRDWRSGTYYNEILEVRSGAVRLDRLNAGAPLLDTHDDWSLSSVIGSVVPGTARIEGGKALLAFAFPMRQATSTSSRKSGTASSGTSPLAMPSTASKRR